MPEAQYIADIYLIFKLYKIFISLENWLSRLGDRIDQEFAIAQ